MLTLLLAPALAITTVGGYGLAVWVYQMIAGPPGPPAKADARPGHRPQDRKPNEAPMPNHAALLSVGVESCLSRAGSSVRLARSRSSA